jgi:predicted nicotinamide N-methyase
MRVAFTLRMVAALTRWLDQRPSVLGTGTLRYREAMTSAERAFVRRHTRLRPVPGLPIRLHLADAEATRELWHDVQLATGDPDTPLPYWAFAWGGGLALATYLVDHPDAVAGRRVVDVASGSGLVAIAAGRAGASAVTAIDIDPFAVAAIPLNAKANGVAIAASRRDPIDDDPPDADVVLVGDACYDAGLAERLLPWLREARQRGSDVLLGDPGRRFLPVDDLVELARYDVRTTSELEDLALTTGRVYALPDPT